MACVEALVVMFLWNLVSLPKQKILYPNSAPLWWSLGGGDQERCSVSFSSRLARILVGGAEGAAKLDTSLLCHNYFYT